MPELDAFDVAVEKLTAISESGVSDDVQKRAKTWLALLQSWYQRLSSVAAEKKPEKLNILLQEIIVDEFWPKLLKLTRWIASKTSQLDVRDVDAADSILQNLHLVLLDMFEYLKDSNSEYKIVPLEKAAQFYDGIDSLRGGLFPEKSFQVKWSHNVINERFEKLIPSLSVFAATEEARASIQTNGPRLFRWIRDLVNKSANQKANPGDYLGHEQLFEKVKKFPRLAKEVFKDRGWFGGKNLWKVLKPKEVFELFARPDSNIRPAIRDLAITNSDFRATLRAGLKELVDDAKSRELTSTELASLEYAIQAKATDPHAQEAMRRLIMGDGLVNEWLYQKLWSDAIEIFPAAAAAARARAATRIQSVWRGYQGRKAAANLRDYQGRKIATEERFNRQITEPGFSRLDVPQQKAMVDYLVAEIETYLQDVKHGPSSGLFSLLTRNDPDLFNQIDARMQQNPSRRFWFLDLIALGEPEMRDGISASLKQMVVEILGPHARREGSGIFNDLYRRQTAVKEFNSLWGPSMSPSETETSSQAQKEIQALLANPATFELLKNYYHDPEAPSMTLASKLNRLILTGVLPADFFETNRHVTNYLFKQTGSDRPNRLFEILSAPDRSGDLAESARAIIEKLKRVDTARVTAEAAPTHRPVKDVIADLVLDLPGAFLKKDVGLPSGQFDVLEVLSDPAGEIKDVNIVQSLLKINKAVTKDGTRNPNWAQTWSTAIGETGSQFAGLLLKLHQRLQKILKEQHAADVAVSAGGAGREHLAGTPGTPPRKPSPPNVPGKGGSAARMFPRRADLAAGAGAGAGADDAFPAGQQRPPTPPIGRVNI